MPVQVDPSGMSTYAMQIANLIGTRPYDVSIYRKAFTHKSMNVKDCQERMEHLGDAVLGFLVTSMLYEKYPKADEGTLTQYKTKIVNGETLAMIGRNINLASFILVDEVASEALNHDKIYEDTLEALIAAIYIDSGLTAAKTFVHKIIKDNLTLDFIERNTNYKEILRMFAMRTKSKQPTYDSAIMDDGYVLCHARFSQGGEDHYEYEAQGIDINKKKAEMQAAQKILFQIGYEE